MLKRHLQIRVAERCLDRLERGTTLHEPRGERVPEVEKRMLFRDESEWTR
jgi:hypothetical protein